MKKFNKVSVAVLVLVLMFGLNSPVPASAAFSPSLGLAATFGVLASTFTRNVGLTSITGDLGYTTLSGGGTHTVIGGTTHVADATYTSAGTDQASALASLASQPCTFTFPAGAVNLATDTTHGPIGVYTSGVYCTTAASAASIGTGGITLSGPGTYIFRINGALTTVNNSNVTLSNGATSCDVFWTPTGATTLGSNTTFVGTDIDASGITVGNATSWIGRALAFGGTVTTDTDAISSTCSSAPLTPSLGGGAGLSVQVPPLINITKIPTPLSLPSGPGSVTYDYAVSNLGTVAMNNITVTDNQCAAVAFVSGDTNNNLMLDVTETWNYRCTMLISLTTSNTALATGQANGFTVVDTANATVVVGSPIVPPLIHVVKRPSVFVLPAGGGAVVYSYTVTNPGTVPLNNVTITDDKCTGLPGRVVGHPGDLNQNNLLEPSEAWSFVCQTNITQTTTNTGTAEGSANGLIAIDYSLATVAVALPGLPITGFPPADSNVLWKIIIPAGALLALFSFYLARKKQII